MMPKQYTMLCLGDSYTIGESVAESERFPVQTISLLKGDGVDFVSPRIIATTGWTTDELQAAIDAAHINSTYDVVTLLIGVNNQYRGRSPEEYRQQFIKLLQQAITFAGNKPLHVFVLSIPDWGVTPFAAGSDRRKIATEIDLFSKINKEESAKAGANYLDITPVSRQAASDNSLVAHDGLHPSGKMYALWSQSLAEMIEKSLK